MLVCNNRQIPSSHAIDNALTLINEESASSDLMKKEYLLYKDMQ